MPVTDPRVKIGDSDADALTADVRTTDPSADTPGVVVRVAGAAGTSPPVGAATAAKQDEQTALLTTIDADTGGIATSTASIDGKVALESGGNLASARTDLDTLVARTPVLGQAVAAASTPVVLPTSQAGGALALDVSLTQVQALVGAAAPARAVYAAGYDTRGNLRPMLVDTLGRAIGVEIDMVSRQHVALMQMIQFGYAASAADTYRWSSVTATGGTVAYNSTTGEYEVAVTTTSGSTAIQIHNQIAYYRTYCQYGAVMSGSLLTTNTMNQRLEWGVTSGIASSATSLQTSDAIGFAHAEGVFNIFFRSSIGGGPNVTTAQSTWNVDRLDGSGGALNPSGYNLTAAQLLNINLFDVRFVWLGAFGIEWRVGERLVHRVFFDAAPYTITEPFARTPHMRMYIFARNSGAAAANTFSFNCGCIYTNGGDGVMKTPSSSSRTTAVTVPAASGAVPIFALRPAATLGGISNIRRFIPDHVVVRTTTQDFRLEIWLGRATDFTLTGAAWGAPPNSPRSAAERDIASTAITIGAGATLLGGITIIGVGGGAVDTFEMGDFFGETKATVGVNGDGVLDNFVVTATALAGINGTAAVQSITWTELG